MKTKNSVVKILLAQFLLMACASIASAQYIQILGYTNYTWRYNDVSTAASNPTGLFQATDYDDSGPDWKTGRALFGNDSAGIYDTAAHPFRGGINGFATPLDRTPTSGRITFYFRTHFNIASINPGAQLFSTNYLDDSCIIYINGVEAGRTRIGTAGTPAAWGDFGSNPATEGAPTRVDLLPDSLVVGDNVLAVEVHQSGATSSDVAFAMNLIMINPFFPQILDANEPADRNILENRSTTLRCVADASPPISYQWVKDDVDIAGATSPTHTIALMQPGDAGNYYCRVSNPVGSTNSRTAVVGYTQDDVPPAIVGVIASDFTTITVQFNEAMDTLQTPDSFNWGVFDANNEVLPIGGVVDLTVGGSVATIRLEGATFAENTLYRVEITGAVADLTGRNTLAGEFRTFRTYISGCGGVLWEAFDTASAAGNAVALLTSHPNYPNNPRDFARVAGFDSRHGYPDDTHEQFGGRLRGLFVPNISGPWRFYLASDDGGELWVNPTGPDAAGRQLVARELNCCNNFLAEGNTQTSVPLNLQAGQAYYVEALYKEGTGGDWLKIAARPASEPVPVGGNSDQGTLSPNALSGGAVGSPAGPVGVLSHVTISSQPASTTAQNGTVAQFSVQLSPDVIGCYQWKRDGVDIPGAIRPSYLLTASMADNQAKFSVVVSLMGGTTLTSTEATLTVFDDVDGPAVVSASRNAAGDVVVVFDEAVGTATANNPANYLVDGVAPATATASGSTVVLGLTSPLAFCPVEHTVRVSAVTDAFGNVLEVNPTTVSFSIHDFLLLPISATKTWKYEESGNELGTDWFGTAFDDTTWPSGPGLFGIETATALPAAYPIRTAINWSPVKLSVYFRTHFDLPTSPSTITNLQLQHVIDDGAVFYLNGQELTRVRFAAGPVDNTIIVENAAEPHVLATTTIPTTLLQSGDNVLAARVNQSGTGSSDMVFGAGLLAFVSGCQQEIRLSITRNGNQVTITSTGPGTIYKASSLDGTWVGVGAAPQTVTIGPGPEFFEIRP